MDVIHVGQDNNDLADDARSESLDELNDEDNQDVLQETIPHKQQLVVNKLHITAGGEVCISNGRIVTRGTQY